MENKGFMGLQKMRQKFATIYADPPWFESGGGRIKRGADRHYPLMKTEEISNLAPLINYISSPNSHLYLWVTNNFLQDGLEVMKSWGYRYVTKITWFKDGNIGLGQYFRGVTEDCLFGVKGKVPYKIIEGKRQQGLTGFHEMKASHSAKPFKMKQMIKKVSYGPFVEIFARPKEVEDLFASDEGDWSYIGNQVDGRDIRELSLEIKEI
jgi:N6-adenosine-specific RNA methylase IME4